MSQGSSGYIPQGLQDKSPAANLHRMMYQGRSFSSHERNCCFLNTLGQPKNAGRFATISAISGLDYDDDGRALAQTDWDHDGDVDLWITNRNAPRIRLMRNELSGDNRFVVLKLLGNGTNTNRNGVGARVQVVLKPTADSASRSEAETREPDRIIKTLHAGEGFLSQSSEWLHVGLGEHAEIERVLVTWPNAESSVEDFGPLAINERYVLEQGSGQAKLQTKRTGELAIKPSATQVPAAEARYHIPITFPMAVPALGYHQFGGKAQDITFKGDQVCLINFWSSNCKPCLEELAEFVRRADELKQAGVRVVALSVDVLESNESDAAKTAQATAQRLKLPFEVGLAPPGVVEDLRRLHDTVIAINRPLPMPVSFLINGKGELTAIYKGTVGVDTLLADAKVGDLDLAARVQRAAAFPGKLVEDEIIMSSMAKYHAIGHYKLARQYMSMNRVDDAVKEYQSAMELWPNSGTIVNDFAVLLFLKREFAKASEHFRRAMELKPADPDIPFNLARALEGSGKSDEAQAVLESNLKAFPTHSNSHFQLGVLAAKRNDSTGARAHFERAIENNPRNDRALFSLGNLQLNAGEFENAKKHLLMALEIAPQEPVVLTAVGKVLMREENWTEAESRFRQAVQIAPTLVDAQYQLGLVLAAQNKTAEAIRQFEITLQLEKNHAGAKDALRRMMRTSVSSN